MQLTLNLPNPLAARQALFLSTDGQPFTTSRAIAERFGKNHRDVLRAIENLLAVMPDPEFSRRNFALRNYQYTTARNQVREAPEYHLTHDGFAFLAMRFTGAEAMAWQIAFLQAFNAMEAELHAQREREASALYRLRPRWQPIAAHPDLRRAQLIDLTGHRSVSSITACRRRMRAVGLLAA